MREVLSEYELELVQRAHFLGVPPLRKAIADYLYRSRGMSVSPECIVIGASIEYLYEKLIKLLPERSVYGAENPGYRKIPRIYEEFGLPWKSIEMDESGVSMASLRESGANVVHVSPEHHYPLGTVTTAGRRQELLSWAAEAADRYIIEDDYDCEFRYSTKSIPALQSMDLSHRVIYMNTFSKSLAPAIRISYMVLPPALLERYQRTLGFYSCTVPAMEQYTLARFLEDGHFDAHVNRMRVFYRARRDAVLQAIEESPLAGRCRVMGENAGLHFLLELDTEVPDEVLARQAEERGLRLAFLSDYQQRAAGDRPHTLVVNYPGTDLEHLAQALDILTEVMGAE